MGVLLFNKQPKNPNKNKQKDRKEKSLKQKQPMNKKTTIIINRFSLDEENLFVFIESSLENEKLSIETIAVLNDKELKKNLKSNKNSTVVNIQKEDEVIKCDRFISYTELLNKASDFFVIDMDDKKVKPAGIFIKDLEGNEMSIGVNKETSLLFGYPEEIIDETMSTLVSKDKNLKSIPTEQTSWFIFLTLSSLFI